MCRGDRERHKHREQTRLHSAESIIPGERIEIKERNCEESVESRTVRDLIQYLEDCDRGNDHREDVDQLRNDDKIETHRRERREQQDVEKIRIAFRVRTA